jgi:outer membrane protein OmpA-like peptidoglycan-associated protein
MKSHNRADAGCRFSSSARGPGTERIDRLRALAVVMLALALAACATHPKPAPVVAPPPTKPSHKVPAAHPRVPAPAPTPQPAPAVAVLDSHSSEQDKTRIKQALAINSSGVPEPADVGYYMDVLQGRLKQVAGKNVGIARHNDRIVIDLTSRVGFASDSAQISAGNHEILASLSRVFMEYRMTLVSVQVRAENTGAHAINPQLSEQRALAIAHDLADAGIAPNRIVVIGAGPENRVHVELQVEPIVHALGSGH